MHEYGEVTIEKHIQTPRIFERGRKPRFPLAEMEVGDSIALDDEIHLKSARNSAYAYKKKNPGWNYGATKYKDGSGRLWRTA